MPVETANAAQPLDRDQVLAAARLGWSLAEHRGRVREVASGLPASPTPPAGILHLGQERTHNEQLIEYGVVVASLAKRLDVDVPAKSLTRAPKSVYRKTASAWLREAAWEVAKPPDPTDQARVKAAATTLADLFVVWDARIQDELASSPPRSAAYQLGRGVAEIRWGIDVRRSIDDDLEPVSFLLGTARGERLDRLIARLSAYYDPVTRNALESSLRAWRIYDEATTKAPNDEWRAALVEQATIWHDLILAERDGASLVSPRDILDKPSSLIRVARRLAPELLFMALGVILLIVAAYVLTTPGVAEWVGAVAAVLGVTGITAGGLAAKARTSALDLFTQVRNDVYRDVVAERAIVVPASVARNGGGSVG